MDLPEIVSYDEWRAARIALLEKEKAATRARDELNTERRRLPMGRQEDWEEPKGRSEALRGNAPDFSS